MTTDKRLPRPCLPVLLPCLCAAALVLTSCARSWPAGELRPGGSAGIAVLRPGETHRYRLPLQKGSLLRLVVDQRGIDAVVSLEDPAGDPMLETDRIGGNRGPELILAVAERSGDYSLVVRGPGARGPGRYEAHIEALRPATEADRRSARAYKRFLWGQDRGDDETERLTTQALAVWQELGDPELEGEALYSLAQPTADLQRAIQLFRAAAAAFHRAGDPVWEARARAALGAKLVDKYDVEGAESQYGVAFQLAREEDDPLTEAKALHGLGQVYQYQGELQKALDHYTEALGFFQKSGIPHPSPTLHQLGVLYARYLHDEKTGARYLRSALKFWDESRFQESGKALTLNQLGKLAYQQGRLDEAHRSFEKALHVPESERDPCDTAVVLMRLALVENAQGARRVPEERKDEALSILGTSKACLKSEPTVYLLAGQLAEERGQAHEAKAAYDHCKELFERLGQRMGEAECLTGIARNERKLGDTHAALDANRRALDIMEGVRPTVSSEDLRISFFSGAQEAFDFQIDLLLELGEQMESWVTAEEARDRALQDLLAAAGMPRNAEERALQHKLNVLQTRWNGSTKSSPEAIRSLRREIDETVSALQRLRGESRSPSNAFVSLSQAAADLEAARHELLDDDTVLLEYRLGEDRSTVWAVTRETLTAIPNLPSKDQIRRFATTAVDKMLQSRWQRPANQQALCDLSRTILAPVAPFLGHRRLVIVAEGALETVSFAALPRPPAGPSGSKTCPKRLLVEDHEIVSLPSLATLLTQHRRLEDRQPAQKWLAVVANPVYRTRRPLPGSGQEAERILRGRPRDKVLQATGIAASPQIVISGRLRDFRILHFATHSTSNPEQPLRSALHLSESDSAGGPVQGDLFAYQIYDLDLPAELVVLSACETARGREVPGEGMVSGLPRAFLYAGADRVLVSLWEVGDKSTRDLMALFYQDLFDRKLPPDQALAEAQRTLRKSRKAPRQWAGFVLVGDWRPLPSFSR